MKAQMEFHEVANIFPLMQGTEFDALKADIAANGLHVPIWTYKGRIIDGRNRWRACQETGVKPAFQEYAGPNGASLLAFVVSLNLQRRHLNETQRAVVAAKLANLENGHRPTSANLPRCAVTQPQAAQMMNVSERAIRAVKAIERQAPDLLAQMETGEITAHEAAKEARKRAQIDREHAARASQPAVVSRWTVTDNQTVVPCAAVITDPPYGILDQAWEPDDLGAFTRDWARRWAQSGADLIAVFFSQRYLWDGRAWLDDALTGYTFQQLLIWHYPNNKSPQSRMGFKQTWEPIYLYRRQGCKREIGIGGGEWGDGLNDFDCHVAAVPQSNFNDANRKVHPAQKPVEVMRWLVNALTQPGELVADPFCGSGTTGIAAVQLGRRFHGVEIDAAMAEKAVERIACYGERGLSG